MCHAVVVLRWLRRRPPTLGFVVQRDDVHAGDTQGLQWQQEEPAGALLRDVLSHLSLPHPDGSRGWVVHVLQRGKGAMRERYALAVLRDGLVVMKNPDLTVSDVLHRPGTSLQLEHRSSNSPRQPDHVLLAEKSSW